MGEGWGEGDHPDSCAPTPLTRLKHPCYIIPQARQPTSSLIRKGSRSPMSRYSLHRARRIRAVWDRTATGTRLLPLSFPNPVSLPSPLDPPRMYLKTSAPSRPTSPQRHNAADARVPSPRMITHGSYPLRACPTTVDARVLSWMLSRSASLGVDADACGYTSRMISRSALTGVDADACAYPQMISHAPSRAAEGALATLILTLSLTSSPFSAN